MAQKFGVQFLIWRYGLVPLILSDLKNIELKIDF